MKVIINQQGLVCGTVTQGNIDIDSIVSSGGQVLEADDFLNGKALKVVDGNIVEDTTPIAVDEDWEAYKVIYHDMFEEAKAKAIAKGKLNSDGKVKKGS